MRYKNHVRNCLSSFPHRLGFLGELALWTRDPSLRRATERLHDSPASLVVSRIGSRCSLSAFNYAICLEWSSAVGATGELARPPNRVPTCFDIYG